MGPATDPSATLAIIVGTCIDHAAGEEVGQEFEFLSPQILDRGIDQLIEIMGQDLGGESHRDAISTLGEQKRKFHREGHRFFLPSVVTQLPFRGLGIEGHFQGELAQARLDVSGGSGIVSRAHIPPVTLGIDQEVLLAQVHQGVLDAGIPVRVVLHRLPDDVGRLVQAPVIHLLHRMQDATLHGLQAVFDGRHGPFQDDI